MAVAGDGAQVETPKDVGTKPKDIVKRWLIELELSGKNEDSFRRLGQLVIDRYHGDYAFDQKNLKASDSYNILFANVETKRPVLYNSTPVPRVRRRFNDPDPVGGWICEILQRTLKFAVDSNDFDDMAQKAIMDALLPGRGVARIRYMPTVSASEEAKRESLKDQPKAEGTGVSDDKPLADTKAPKGKPVSDTTSQGDSQAQTDELLFEEVTFEYVPWKRFRHGPGETWAMVDWISFEHELTRQELIDKFGEEIGNLVTLDVSNAKQDSGDAKSKTLTERELFKRATVHEVWDKLERKVVFVSPGYLDKPLKEQDDPLNLTGFFPCPRPLYGVEATGTLTPVAP